MIGAPPALIRYVAGACRVNVEVPLVPPVVVDGGAMAIVEVSRKALRRFVALQHHLVISYAVALNIRRDNAHERRRLGGAPVFQELVPGDAKQLIAFWVPAVVFGRLLQKSVDDDVRILLVRPQSQMDFAYDLGDTLRRRDMGVSRSKRRKLPFKDVLKVLEVFDGTRRGGVAAFVAIVDIVLAGFPRFLGKASALASRLFATNQGCARRGKGAVEAVPVPFRDALVEKGYEAHGLTLFCVQCFFWKFVHEVLGRMLFELLHVRVEIRQVPYDLLGGNGDVLGVE